MRVTRLKPLVGFLLQRPLHRIRYSTLSGSPPTTDSTPKPPAARHLFDTYKLVSLLCESGYSYGQSFAIMQALSALLVNSSEYAKAEFLSRGELENEVYLFQAAMSELRSETQITRLNETAALKQDLQALQREYELFERQVKEDLANMRHEVDIDVNNRKNETRAGQNATDIKIQELNNRFTIMLGDLRTRLEGYKWDTTRKGILGLVLILSLLFAAAWYKGEVERRAEQERLRKKAESQSDRIKKTKSIETLVSLG